MRHTRTYLVTLLILGGLLAACGGGDETNENENEPPSEPMRIEDLPPESLLMVGSSGPRVFEDSVEDFLALLPFEPLLPSVVPNDWPLLSAMLIPSHAPTGKVDLEATLVLGYGPEGEAETSEQATSVVAGEGVTVTQQKQPLPDVAPAAIETVDVNGVEGYILGTGERDTGILMFHACEISVTIASPVLDTEALVALGESLTEGCTTGEVG